MIFCFFVLFSVLLALVPVSVKANGPYSETWVDDDFWSGTPGWGDTHFDEIQDGVDAVADYGVVHVYPGYYDWVEIDHPLTLEGAGRGQSFIQSEEVLILIFEDDVYVSGFTLRYSLVAVLVTSPTVYDDVISDCEIYDAVVGVYFDDCVNCSVVNCEIHHCDEIGVCFDDVSMCRIAGCHIHDNTDFQGDDFGVLLSETPFSAWGTIICGCLIEDNGEGIVLKEGTTYSHIVGNTIRNNGLADLTGIVVEYGAGWNWAILNNIYDNDYGVYVGSGTNGPTELGAWLNWWGHTTGPSNAGPGSGDAISEDVYFDPWLTVMVTNGTAEWVEGDGVLDGLDETDAEVVYTNAHSPESPMVIGVVSYAANPGDPFDGDIGKHIDVFHNYGYVEELEIRLYYTDADISGFDESSLQMYYMSFWDGDGWQPCSNTGVVTEADPPYSGYIWAIINDETTPNIYNLAMEDGPFGARGDEEPTGPAEPVGGDILAIDKLAVLTPYFIMAIVFLTATSFLIKKRKH